MSPNDADTITWDLVCVRCGYNLRTLRRETTCPECGEPVARSLEANPWWLRGADALRRYAWLHAWLWAAMAAMVLGFGLGELVRPDRYRRFITMRDGLAWLFVLGPVLAVSWQTWRLTAKPAGDGLWPMRLTVTAAIVRAATVLRVPAWAALTVFVLGYSGGISPRAIIDWRPWLPSTDVIAAAVYFLEFTGCTALLLFDGWAMASVLRGWGVVTYLATMASAGCVVVLAALMLAHRNGLDQLEEALEPVMLWCGLAWMLLAPLAIIMATIRLRRAADRAARDEAAAVM